MAQQVEETAAAILAAKTFYGQLLLGEDSNFDAVRAAYKRLRYLHPDKQPGCPLAAEAFKVVTNAYNELQALHECSRGIATARQPAEGASHSRWGAFAGQPAWASAVQQVPADLGVQQPTAAPAAKPNRWGRPSAEFGKLLKAHSAAQPARPVAQPQPPADAQEDYALPASSPDSDFKPSKQQCSIPARTGVAPSAFYTHRSNPKGELQPHARSLYALFANSSGHKSSAPAATADQGPSSQPEQQQQLPANNGGKCAAEASMKWGSKSAFMELLRHPGPQHDVAAAASHQAVGAAPAAAADPGQQMAAALGSSKQPMQRRAEVVETSDSEYLVASGDEASSSSSSSGIDEPDAGQKSDFPDPNEVQQPAPDMAGAQLEAAVQRHQTGGLLAAQGLGAAAVQAGRKRALQRHYSRRGKGRQKKRTSTGMQAKLQLVAVGSKRAKKI